MKKTTKKKIGAANKKVGAVPKNTRNPERTRARLLNAAITLFSNRGYHGVSVDEIVNTAGVNKRMVYHYFGSKEEIYLSVLKDVYARLGSVEKKALKKHRGGLIDNLRQVMYGLFEFYEKNPEFARLIIWENLNGGKLVPKVPYELKKNPFLDRFSSIIKEGSKKGVFRKDLNTKHLLIEFIGMGFIYYSNTYTLSQALDIDLKSKRERKKALESALDLFFNGIVLDSSKDNVL